ncbi:MAG: DUF3662 domain-containing protein [Candidatus Ancillula sp.]|jgi:hypothetical protein|nr:DUF3662 domain-containing protein [Candidatus Ancillula sp.]
MCYNVDMGLLDKFEKGVEGAISSVFAKLGSRELKPVDLLVALRQELDDKTITVSNNRKVAPNSFCIKLSTEDFDKIESWGSSDFASELANGVLEHGSSECYAFIGSISVVFEESTENETGSYQIISKAAKQETGVESISDDWASRVSKEQVVAFSNLLTLQEPPIEGDPNSDYPLLEIGGLYYLLSADAVVIGRGSDCDIILEDSGVSRHHLKITVTADSVFAEDIGSTNGVFVEGHSTSSATLVNGNTIVIGHTYLVYWDSKQGGRNN